MTSAIVAVVGKFEILFLLVNGLLLLAVVVAAVVWWRRRGRGTRPPTNAR